MIECKYHICVTILILEDTTTVATYPHRPQNNEIGPRVIHYSGLQSQIVMYSTLPFFAKGFGNTFRAYHVFFTRCHGCRGAIITMFFVFGVDVVY